MRGSWILLAAIAIAFYFAGAKYPSLANKLIGGG